MGSRAIHQEDFGATITFRHPDDGRLRTDFAMGATKEAVGSLLRSYPEPWQVVCISHPGLIFRDLQGRLPTYSPTKPLRPEERILRGLGAKGRLA